MGDIRVFLHASGLLSGECHRAFAGAAPCFIGRSSVDLVEQQLRIEIGHAQPDRFLVGNVLVLRDHD